VSWLDDYLSRTPANIEDDVMVGSMILFSPATKNDPNESLKLADSISDPQTRSIYQQQIFQSWGRSDPGSAVEYVLNSPTIAPEQKQLFIQQIQDANRAVNSPNQPEQ